MSVRFSDDHSCGDTDEPCCRHPHHSSTEQQRTATCSKTELHPPRRAQTLLARRRPQLSKISSIVKRRTSTSSATENNQPKALPPPDAEQTKAIVETMGRKLRIDKVTIIPELTEADELEADMCHCSKPIANYLTSQLRTIADVYRREASHVVDPPLCLLYTSPSPRDGLLSRMPSSA